MKLLRSGLVLLTLLIITSPSYAGLVNVFCDDFSSSSFSDGALQGQGWNAQGNWTVAGGRAGSAGTAFHRARRFAGFRVEDTEQLKITLSDVMINGSGSGSSSLFAFGFAKQNEHAGATTPQVRSELQFNGTSLSIGGATDTGYSSGESFDLMLTFTRSGNSWGLSTMLTNNTDGTSFTGTNANPTDLAGTVSGSNETATQWLNQSSSNILHFGMRELGNFGNSISMAGVKVDLITIEAVPEPSSAILFVSSMLIVLRRKR